MSDADANRQKAMGAVRAMFARYKLVAAQRPEGHVVRMPDPKSIPHSYDQDFDAEVMESMKLVDAGLDGSVVYEMTITPNFSNLNSTVPTFPLARQANSAKT
jgi:acyl-coenzyme A thioesterase 13